MEHDEIRDRVTESAAKFLTAELDFAFNLLDSAHVALSERHRKQCIADAQKAYWAAIQFLPLIQLDSATKANIDRRLSKLQKLFDRLGTSLSQVVAE